MELVIKICTGRDLSMPINDVNIVKRLDQEKMTANLVYHMNEHKFKIPNLPHCNKIMIYSN